MKGEDTKENRKNLALKEAEKFKTLLFIPDSVKNNVYEGFEPLLIAGEMADKYFEQIVNMVMDFDNTTNSDA